MDAVRGVGVYGANQVLVDFLRHEGGQRGHQLDHGDQTGVQGDVAGELVGVAFIAAPEAAAAAADVPVGKAVDKFLDPAAGVGGVVVIHIAVGIGHQFVEFGKNPAVKLVFRLPAVGFLGWVESVYGGVAGEKGVDVP